MHSSLIHGNYGMTFCGQTAHIWSYKIYPISRPYTTTFFHLRLFEMDLRADSEGPFKAPFKVLHPNKRSSEHTQIMHMYLKIRKEGNKCHELPQYHQVLIEL